MASRDTFTFEISLSVLNHLGRNLYRSFATVLGEAISNSWDANANNVRIYIDKEKNSFVVKDDGDGMTANDFQNKFLKIGYSKRKHGETHSPGKKRPYIGRKGIGKLALLSCSDKVTVISKTLGGEYVGGVIDNSGLDKAITEDLNPQQYPLGKLNPAAFREYTQGHKKGTIIFFENMKDGLRNNLANIRKILALYFRFSLLEESFKIFVEDTPVTLDDLNELAGSTEFLWIINGLRDPYVIKKLKYEKVNLKKDVNLLEPGKTIRSNLKVNGFIASVRKPTHLKIFGTDERVGIDLFVNGRLRERDVPRHIPTAKIPENYLYGQIHFDGLDDGIDRFATSREGIVADDEKFGQLLDSLSDVIASVIADWDVWRRKHHRDGDPDNSTITKKERKAEELYYVISNEYEIPEDSKRPERSERVDQWLSHLAGDARYNFTSYAECFVSENLVRKHIEAKPISLTKEAKDEIQQRKENEKIHKDKGNVSIEIRKTPTDISYLSMDDLANLVDKRDRIKEASLSRDAEQYKPIRDALMHTALLTDEAKMKLTTVFRNVTARVRALLSNG